MGCDRCGSIEDLTYFVEGDGDGVEFLVEEAVSRDARTAVTTVMLRYAD